MGRSKDTAAKMAKVATKTHKLAKGLTVDACGCALGSEGWSKHKGKCKHGAKPKKGRKGCAGCRHGSTTNLHEAKKCILTPKACPTWKDGWRDSKGRPFLPKNIRVFTRA